MRSDWKDFALCFNHENSAIWFSYKKADVDKAKSICKECTVRPECFTSMWNTGDFYGVNGGVSEFDYLMMTWKEAKNEKESNSSRASGVLKRIMQTIK